MDLFDANDPIWSDVRRFADRHIRACTWGLCLLVIPIALLFLIPSILIVTATPITAPVRLKATLSLTYLDKDGKVIGRQGPVAGQYVRLAQMPAFLPQAFLAMEDRRFYAHHGVDFIGLSRAAYTDLRARRFVAGGSTISQQTAKLLFTDGSRTFSRKLDELGNAAALEKSFSKTQILEIYLNRIYMGDGTYGVDTAARNYFGVPASRLTLPQAAMLAGLTRAPSVYSPRRNLATAQKRARMVLAAMVENGDLAPAQAHQAEAHAAAIIPAHHDDHDYVLDAAADEVQKLVAENDLPARALFVHTAIDSSLQAQAEDVVHRTITKQGPKLGFSQAALVLMTPDGGIASMVGGADYRKSVFNRVTQAHRQPGSAFKVFVYLAALERGASPWEWRDDQPVNIAGYQPSNYQDASYGRLRLIDALARSVNTISVNLAQETGMSNVSAAAKRLGIASALHDNASLALGTDVVTPLELTAAYGAFANGGKTVTPHLVTSLSDANGAVLFQRHEPPTPAVMTDTVRRDMTTMLCHVLEAGTGTAARLPGRDAGGKTGTTQDYRDAWFMGFTAGHVAGVWIGNDDNSPMRKVTGGTVPAQIWKTVMLAAEARAPGVALERSPAPPEVTEPQQMLVTYSDDPMAGSTIVDVSAMPQIAMAEAPSLPPALPPPSTEDQPRPQPLTAEAPPALQERQPVRGPLLVHSDQAPMENPPGQPANPAIPLIQNPPYRPQRDTEYSPAGPRAAADADLLYRQREAEYRRVLRQTTETTEDDEVPRPRRDTEYPRSGPQASRENLPFP